jgi:hypothetical protein
MESQTGEDDRKEPALLLADPQTGCATRRCCVRENLIAFLERGSTGTMLSRLVFTIFLTAPPIAALPPRPADEYQVKAAFLYNFARFVEWPPEVFQGPDDPFLICVLGRDPFGQALDDVTSGGTVSGRKILVRHFSEARRVAGCRILFVSPSEPKSDLVVLAEIKMPGVLTVGESGSAVSEGMIILLKLDGRKVRFEIHTEKAARARLRFSSHLLSLATVLKD